MKKYKYLLILAAIALFAGCTVEVDEGATPANGRVEVNPSLLPLSEPKTRVSLDGKNFEEHDVFTLYYNTVNSSPNGIYTKSGNSWTGGRGLFWDDLTRSTPHNFIAVTPTVTGGTNSNPYSFEVKADQSSAADGYIPSDLLVAYATAAKTFDVVNLPFKHVFAHFVIQITDKTTTIEGDKILGSNSTVTLNGINRNSTIAFNSSTTTVTATTATTANPTTIKMRKVGEPTTANGISTYSYEAILPAQTLAKGITFSIVSGLNGKTYSYDLSRATITSTSATTTADMLQQGKTTTLKLSMKKTEITGFSATISDWVKTTAGSDAFPDNYPVLEIKDATDLDKIITSSEDFAGKKIELTGDIDASKLTGLPIGKCPKPFQGIFDGKGYTIYNVKIEKADIAFLGLFGCTEGATIRNLNVRTVTINNTNASSSTASGALIGFARNTNVQNCHITEATVAGKHDNVGGLIGYADGCTVERSSTTATVTGEHNYAGGLIGEALGTTLTECYATGAVKLGETGYYAGGLVGYFIGKITDSYAWGNASCARYAGGLLGGCASSILTSSYAIGVVKESVNGGLIGIAEYLKTADVTHCYWNASATGNNTQTDGVNSGATLDAATNISFTLTPVAVSMGPVLNGLNTTKAWKLGTGVLTSGATT
ncbi:MAG: GLUG motif-containing protein, partial [Tannerellaceae bacterium]